MTRAFALQGSVIIDGITCDQHIMLDSLIFPDRLNSIGVSFARTSEFTQRDFMFSAIQVTGEFPRTRSFLISGSLCLLFEDDDAYLDTIDQTYNFGTITLELWRLTVLGVASMPIEHQSGRPVLESQLVHERSKKAGTHHTRQGNYSIGFSY